MGDPWARVRISIEQPGTSDLAEKTWVSVIPIYPGDDLRERVESAMGGWLESQFRHAVEDSWAKR